MSSYTEKTLSDLNAKFIEGLQNPARLPWQKPWATLSPVNALTSRPYKGVNRFTLSQLPYSRPLFATFKQWQSLGHFVRKGEKGHAVLIYRPLDSDRPTTSKSPAPALPTESKAKSGDSKERKFFLSVATVFNFEQLDPSNPFTPPPLPAPVADPCADALAPLQDLLRAFMIREGIGFVEEGERAFYRPSTDSIRIPAKNNFKDFSSYLLTLGHECAHATGIKKRLARYDEKDADPFGSKPYAIEELVAEVTASYAYAKHAGEIPVGHVQNAQAYLANWIKALESDSRFLVKAFSQAEKALQWLETSTRLTYDETPNL